MGMNSMFQLATIAKMWNATFPIPFTTNSKLYGLPDGGLNLDITFIYDFRKLMYMCRASNSTSQSSPLLKSLFCLQAEM